MCSPMGMPVLLQLAIRSSKPGVGRPALAGIYDGLKVSLQGEVPEPLGLAWDTTGVVGRDATATLYARGTPSRGIAESRGIPSSAAAAVAVTSIADSR